MSNLTPITREEQFYAAILKGSADDLPAPITRQEEYLYAIAKQGGPGGTVNSVNGKMGNVVLNAEDVGAAEKEVTDTIAPTEDGTTLSQDYLIGNQFIRDNVLYAAKVDLTQGALWSTLVLDTDYEVARDVSEQLNSLKEALTNEVDTRAELGAHNFWPLTAATQIDSGVTFTIGKTLVVSGTVTQGVGYASVRVTDTNNVEAIAGKQVVLSCNNKLSGTIYVLLVCYNGSTIVLDQTINDNNETPFTIPATTTNMKVRVYVMAGFDGTATDLQPTIKLASDKATAYQPYAMTNRDLTDIRLKYVEMDITGTAVTVTDAGKYLAIIDPTSLLPSGAHVITAMWGGSGGWQADVWFEVLAHNNNIIIVSDTSTTLFNTNRTLRIYYI